ncbi:MAG: hypothetical protein N3A66_00685, partial [Planctomycetota bacterium]|nr:hypothetical protein [Planctomycetota bacterium]
MADDAPWQRHCQNPPVNRWLIALLAFLVLIQVRADRQPAAQDSGWEGYRGLRNLARLRAYLRDRAWSPPPEQRLFWAAAQAMRGLYPNAPTDDIGELLRGLQEELRREGTPLALPVIFDPAAT